MDPLQLEIDRYQRERDQLAGQLTDAEAQPDFNLQLAQFEDVFFERSKRSGCCWSVGSNGADTLAIIRHLEQCQWKGENPSSEYYPY